MSSIAEDFHATFTQSRSIRGIWEKATTRWERFQAFREIYEILDESIRAPGPNNRYFVDWLAHATPIERLAWGEIQPMPLLPQYPVLNYFVDFGDPVKKIGLECDGKDFHSFEKDAERNKRMSEAGWTIYRVTGAECVRVQATPWGIEYDFDREATNEEWDRFWFQTVDGVCAAMKGIHYPECPNSPQDYLCVSRETLNQHLARW